jgi:hypothetical protein
MFIKYGSHSHDFDEIALVITKEAIYNEDKKRTHIRERWDLQGMLIGTTAELSTKIAALEDAYAANQIGGNRVVQPPSFPNGTGAEYATMRTFSIAVEGLRAAGSSTLLHWAESIEWRGTGGPAWVYHVPLYTPIQAQQLSVASVVTITQAGEAVGENIYPTPPSPIWPSQELGTARSIRRERPAMNDTTRRVQWSYTFLAPSALPGYPSSR